MPWSIPADADDYLRLLKAVDRQGFGVHIDVCNGINSPKRFYNNAAFTRDCFAKLGKWVVSCHAKDLAFVKNANVRFDEVIPGTGAIDYRPYLTELARLPQDAPLMMEHLKTAEQYAQSKKHIRGVAKQVGVSFY
jgi:sugar phosphate isomerase/epimerase